MLTTALKTCLQPNILRRISTTNKLTSDELVVHRDSPDNNPDIPFEFTDANMTRIAAMVQHNYPIGAARSALGPTLDIAQRQLGWLPISAMHKVADILYVPRIRVYEWVTFYTMLKRHYRGKFHLKVCHTTPCMLRGADELLDCAERICECKPGGLSSDGLFGLDIVQCAGACANAPVIVVDDDYYEDMTIPDLESLICTLKSGGIPRPGPQSGRFVCEPIAGLTSLRLPPPPPGYKLCLDLFKKCCT